MGLQRWIWSSSVTSGSGLVGIGLDELGMPRRSDLIGLAGTTESQLEETHDMN